MKRRYLSAILFVTVVLSAGSYVLVRSNGDLARAAPRSRPLSDAPWSANVRVNDVIGQGTRENAAIAVDPGGNAYAVWLDSRDYGAWAPWDIYSSFRPAGGTWGVNERVNDFSPVIPEFGYEPWPDIAVDPSGNAYAVWFDSRNGNLDIYFSYRPAGGTWAPNGRVNDDPGAADQLAPAIAVDPSGNAYAVWVDRRNGDYDIYFSYRPAGGSWGANVRVNDDTGDAAQYDPAIAVDQAGNAYAVWEDMREGYDLYFSYHPAGGAWGPNVRVNDDLATPHSPAIAVDAAGNTYAVWEDARHGASDVDIRFSYRPAAGGWGTDVRVNDDADVAWQYKPAIAVDVWGNAYAVWMDHRNGIDWDIYSSYRPAGGSWGANVKVDDDPDTGSFAHSQQHPDIAVDGSGNAYAVWTDNRGTEYGMDIYFSRRPGGETPTYSISGYVRDSGGSGISGVMVSFSGGHGSSTTISSGRYYMSGLPNGTYTVTPSKSGWAFDPPSCPTSPRSVTISGSDQANVNFSGTDNGLDPCDLQPGDILIQRATGNLHHIEHALYQGYWGHTAMYYGIRASYAQVIHSYAPGVTREPISQTGFWTTEDWVVLRLKDQYDHENEQEALAYAEAHEGDPYNSRFGYPEFDDSYYCTSLVWRSYLEADRRINLNTNSEDTVCRRFLQQFCDVAVLPQDIYLSPFLDPVTSRAHKRAVLYLGSPADFYVTDPQGRHVGVDPVTRLVVNEMPNEVFYTGPNAELEFIAIVDMDGVWNVQVVGTATGEYTFVVEAVDRVQPQIETITGTTSPDEIDEYQVERPSYSVYLPVILKNY